MEPGAPSPSVLRALRGAGYREPGVRLPAASEVVDPGGRFAFEVPWPWYEIPPDRLAGVSPVGAPADVVVVAPRTDGDDPLFAVTASTDRADTESSSARRQGRDHATAAGLVWRSTSKLVVGGARGLLTEGTPSGSPGCRAFLLFAPSGDVLVTGRCDVPARSADGYRQHLLSMLASWTWGA
jgi:hypothetical protein